MPEELELLNKPNLGSGVEIKEKNGHTPGRMESLVVNGSSNHSKDKTKLNECEDFEQILDVIGGDGRFQNILLYGVLSPIAALSPFLLLNTIFMWDIPDHWCKVPGRDVLGTTMEEWKNLTLPWETGPDGQLRHSQCKMLDPISKNITQCQNGWEYDTTDYSSTIPSDYDWVCEKDHYATDCFTWSAMGCAIGTVIFGILADKFGRKPVFFLACGTSLVAKTVSMFLAEHYMLYKTLQIFGGFAYPAGFTMPVLISVEVSGTDYRSWIYAVTWMIWVAGNAAIPLIAMVCRRWFIFGLVSTIPCFVFVLYYPILIESPRWLITTGKTKQATEILLKISETNGKTVNREDIMKMVDQVARKQKMSEKESVGVWTLFSKFGIAKNTLMLTLALTVNELLYTGITLNTTHMEGNQFINYFLLALVELPGGWVAGKLAEKTGRRWTQTGFFVWCTLCCVVCAVAVAFPDSALIVIIAALGIKFGVSITSMIVYLQAAELFPTQLRSTGGAVASTVSSFVGIFGPYMVYSGTIHVSFPYALLGIATFIGFLAAMCLPETLKQNLPETVEDANAFGKGQKFWSYLPHTQNDIADREKGMQERGSR